MRFQNRALSRSAEQLVIRTLRAHKLLERAVVAVCADPEKDAPYEVVRPEEYEGKFSIL